MPPTAEAQNNHDALFPGHVSRLKVTDPEPIEYVDNFAFDEVLRYGSLDTRTRARHHAGARRAIDDDPRDPNGEGARRPEGDRRRGADHQMYASAPEDEMHIQRLLSANCFGDHYTRTGIDIKTRELLTFSMLISLGGREPQAKGHVAANLNVDRGVLLSVITRLLPFIGCPAAQRRKAHRVG